MAQDHKKTYLNTRENKRAYRMWNNARQRAKTKGIEFSIPLHWVEDRLTAGLCEVTGIPFAHDYQRLWSPSLDRVDSSKGYTPDNTKMVVFIYNAAKNVGTHEDVLSFARHLVTANDNEK